MRIKAMLQGMETMRAAGEITGLQISNHWLAEACLTARHPAEGLAAVNEAIAAADQLGSASTRRTCIGLKAHPEGHRYSRAIDDLLELPGVSADSKRKIMWDNARKLYQL